MIVFSVQNTRRDTKGRFATVINSVEYAYRTEILLNEVWHVMAYHKSLRGARRDAKRLSALFAKQPNRIIKA